VNNDDGPPPGHEVLDENFFNSNWRVLSAHGILAASAESVTPTKAMAPDGSFSATA
jgi:hypothetical protein